MNKNMLPPLHPGEILREEFMVPLALSSNALARALGITPARVNEIVREQRGISADTALRLGQYFKTSAEFWVNMQKSYELDIATRKAGETIMKIRPMEFVEHVR